jgi:large subunit ribosomal protein L6
MSKVLKKISSQKPNVRARSSRVARLPVVLPPAVLVQISKDNVLVKGPKGEVCQALPKGISVEEKEGSLHIIVAPGATQALAGTIRALIHNHVQGVHIGFVIKLRLVGVGYRAQANKAANGSYTLDMSLGFSHPIAYQAPPAITLLTPTQTDVEVVGVDKQVVGQVAAKIRDYRPPEPYKGKGIRYIFPEEFIIFKEAKKTK